MSTEFVLLVQVAFITFPVIIVWGWTRWFRHPGSTTAAKLSLISFALTTLSALLAIVAVLYTSATPRLQPYDPRLIKIFGGGILLSLTALASALCGVWKRSSLRWHALGCSLVSLAFWAIAAAEE